MISLETGIAKTMNSLEDRTDINHKIWVLHASIIKHLNSILQSWDTVTQTSDFTPIYLQRVGISSLEMPVYVLNDMVSHEFPPKKPNHFGLR